MRFVLELPPLLLPLLLVLLDTAPLPPDELPLALDEVEGELDEAVLVAEEELVTNGFNEFPPAADVRSKVSWEALSCICKSADLELDETGEPLATAQIQDDCESWKFIDPPLQLAQLVPVDEPLVKGHC